MKTWNERITYAREQAGLEKAEFARRVGVKAPTVTDWESGGIKSLSAENLISISTVTGFNPKWLQTGTGPMRPASHVGPVIPADRPIPSSFRSEPEAPQEPGREAAPLPSSASSSALPDLATLLGAASPRSRTAMERIAEAAKDGRLTEDDLELLAQIAARIEGRKG